MSTDFLWVLCTHTMRLRTCLPVSAANLQDCSACEQCLGTPARHVQGMQHRHPWAFPCSKRACLGAWPGNALAANCLLWSPVTAAFAVVRGRRRALDLFSVLQPGRGRRYYGFLSVYYGLMANLDRGTEHLRCPCRCCD